MSFQSNESESLTPSVAESITPPSTSHPEVVRITVTGSPLAVQAIIHDLHSRHFAEVNDWCPPVPTGQVGQVMRVLLKRVWLGDGHSPNRTF